MTQRKAEFSETFKSRMSGKFNERKLLSDFRKAMTVSKQLDETSGVTENEFYGGVEQEIFEAHRRLRLERQKLGEPDDANVLPADSPTEEVPGVVLKAVIIAMPPADRLLRALDYLRTNYCYCLYCCAKYDSEEQLEALCPGVTEDEHEGTAEDLE
eukprot:TRINITY_DN3884_c0_g1_i1.p2 TRINITY_DN3884_c0_g1~~TRINITY_DN3884_c0_g1_i1.p2  ORF type:complete len:156 (-),score=34.17 TRINITY_DN3884_c0_g1_i1:7-474(-)